MSNDTSNDILSPNNVFIPPSNTFIPPSNDTVPPITPQISRYPNPVPTTYQGDIVNMPRRDQTCQEVLSEEIALELDIPDSGEKPLPIFNR